MPRCFNRFTQIDCSNISIVFYCVLSLGDWNQPIAICTRYDIIRNRQRWTNRENLWRRQRSERETKLSSSCAMIHINLLRRIGFMFLFKIQHATIYMKYTILNFLRLYAKYLKEKSEIMLFCCVRNHSFSRRKFCCADVMYLTLSRSTFFPSGEKTLLSLIK